MASVARSGRGERQVSHGDLLYLLEINFVDFCYRIVEMAAEKDLEDVIAKYPELIGCATQKWQIARIPFLGSCPKSVISVRGAAATARSSDRWPR